MLNTDGEVELDSIIMDGKTLATGAISSVRNIANPVSLARAVMEKVYFIFLQIVNSYFCKCDLNRFSDQMSYNFVCILSRFSITLS